MLLTKMGKLDEARPLYEEALQVQRLLMGHHPDTLISMNNMAMLLKAMGELDARRGRCTRRRCWRRGSCWAASTRAR